MLPGGWPVGYDDDHFPATEDKHSIPGSMGTLSFCLQGNISKYTCVTKSTKIGKLFLGFCICRSIHVFAKIWDIHYVWLMQDLSMSVVYEYSCL